MPTYDYDCAACGPFSAYRPMADYAKPADCDTCGVPAPRAYLTAPALANMDAGRRHGMAVNERSRHEPRRVSGAHPAGCGCCAPRKPAQAGAKGGANGGGAKSFPGARPWMISH